MARRLVFNAQQVQGFTLPGAEDSFVSRMLIDNESVGSNSLVVNHFLLRPGKSTYAGAHPFPYDEVYYVLRGRGVLRLGDPPEAFAVTANTVAFIPSGMKHSLDNTGTEDLEMITIMPRQLVEGANTLYDARLRAWGTSFRLVNSE